jgi:hypothetical protein
VPDQGHPAVALSLPDDLALMGVFPFDKLPNDPQEREALLRWRLLQDARAATRVGRVVYRLFPAEGTVHVLVAAVEQSTMAQFEGVCEAASLLPVSVGFESLQLFDACRSVMKGAQEYVFAHLNGEVMTVIAVRRHAPVFLRKRRVKGDLQQCREELLGTMQYIEDQLSQMSRVRAQAIPLYLLQTGQAAIGQTVFQQREEIDIPGATSSRRIVLMPLGWDALGNVQQPNGIAASFMPAVACIGSA